MDIKSEHIANTEMNHLCIKLNKKKKKQNIHLTNLNRCKKMDQISGLDSLKRERSLSLFSFAHLGK